MRSGDTKTFEAAVDWESLLARAGERVPAVDKTRRAFREEALSSVHAFTAGVIAAVKRGGAFRFLRAREGKNGVHALFRLTHADASSFDYLDMAFDPKKPAGAPATDMMDLVDGAPYPQKLRRLFLLVAAEVKNPVDKLRGADQLVALHASEITGMQVAFGAGENQKALDLWTKLPAELKTDEPLLVERLLAARALSDAAFHETLEDARRLAPDSAALELCAIDHFLLENRSGDALGCLDTLERAVSGDAWLDHLRATLWRARGDTEKAREFCRRAIERESTLEDPYWTLFALAIEEKRFDDAVAVAHKLDASFEVDWSEVEKTPAYAALAGTSAWTQWRSTVAKKR